MQTKEIELPKLPGAKLVIKAYLNTIEHRDIAEKNPGMTDGTEAQKITASICLATKGIISWNITDDEDKILEINEENVSKLSMDDITAIILELSGDSKKK